jgi:hypothetical protein
MFHKLDVFKSISHTDWKGWIRNVSVSPGGIGESDFHTPCGVSYAIRNILLALYGSLIVAMVGAQVR